MAENMEQEYKQLQEFLKSAGETAQKIQAELRKDTEFGSIYLNRSKLDVLEKIAGFSTENGKLLDSVKPEIDKLRLQSQHEELKKKKKLAETSGAIIADLMAKMGYEVHGCDVIESYSKEQMNLKTFAVNKQMFDKLFPVSPYSVSSAKKAKEETADEAKTPTSEGYREYYLLHKKIAQCPFDSNQLVYKLVQVENKKGQSKKLNFQICQTCNGMFICKDSISNSTKLDDFKLMQRELPPLEYYLLSQKTKKTKQCPVDSSPLVYKAVQVERKDGQSKKLNFQICQTCNRMFICKDSISNSIKLDDFKLTQRELPSATGSNHTPALNSSNENKKSTNMNCEVGGTVTFGTYPQTKDGTDSTPIEWLVLAKGEDKALLISKYALDCVKYNTEDISVTWETCSLRKWLNNEFYNRAFSAEEKRNIVLSKVTADKNPKYSTNPGNDTNDNVFLLSISEVNRYFTGCYNFRMCAPTDYAVKNGAYTDSRSKDGRASCCWWLRSPGDISYNAANVYNDGSVYNHGYLVDRSDSSVRPCVWVRLF